MEEGLQALVGRSETDSVSQAALQISPQAA
jgi:hypothetical protein